MLAFTTVSVPYSDACDTMCFTEVAIRMKLQKFGAKSATEDSCLAIYFITENTIHNHSAIQVLL